MPGWPITCTTARSNNVVGFPLFGGWPARVGRGKHALETDAGESGTYLFCGGPLDVKRKGTMTVEQTMYLFGGTTPNVTSMGATAAIEGGGATRFFALFNARSHFPVSWPSLTGPAHLKKQLRQSPHRDSTFSPVSFVGKNQKQYSGLR